MTPMVVSYSAINEIIFYVIEYLNIPSPCMRRDYIVSFFAYNGCIYCPELVGDIGVEVPRLIAYIFLPHLVIVILF